MQINATCTINESSNPILQHSSVYCTENHRYWVLVLRFAYSISDMYKAISTLLQYGQSTLLMALETRKVESCVPSLVTVGHVQLLSRHG